ncbi:unnamed protein product [Protopolystoma xenopodis]|uniref:Uncharacterized protein n=1 Tax=Protopolystoma xenopodis TaxID=117903 RepID=A0A448WWL3_9PLAT|nr:unnamed protein product [Protopolystoma xenopodis]
MVLMVGLGLHYRVRQQAGQLRRQLMQVCECMSPSSATAGEEAMQTNLGTEPEDEAGSESQVLTKLDRLATTRNEVKPSLNVSENTASSYLFHLFSFIPSVFSDAFRSAALQPPALESSTLSSRLTSGPPGGIIKDILAATPISNGNRFSSLISLHDVATQTLETVTMAMTERKVNS